MANSKRHKPLSLLLMVVGGDKTNCVSVSRLKSCSECRIQEADSCENVGGNIDDWDLSAWNTKKHPTLHNALKWIQIWKGEAGKRMGNLWRNLAVLMLQPHGSCAFICCRGLSWGSWQISSHTEPARILRISASVIFLVLICIQVIKLLDTK